MQQTEIICLEDLVKQNHNYRKFAKIFNFKKIEKHLKKAESDSAYKGYGIQRLFKCLLLQFIENLSDREMQKSFKGYFFIQNFQKSSICNSPNLTAVLILLSDKISYISFFAVIAMAFEFFIFSRGIILGELIPKYNNSL